MLFFVFMCKRKAGPLDGWNIVRILVLRPLFLMLQIVPRQMLSVAGFHIRFIGVFSASGIHWLYHTMPVPDSRLGGYGTLSTDLLTDYHHYSITELSIRWRVSKIGKDFPVGSDLRHQNVQLCIPMSRSTSMDSTTTGRPCVCVLWRYGLTCHVSGAWHSCVAAHRLKDHCYRQAPPQYVLRC